jgi:SAM-dependent methyltransferase
MAYSDANAFKADFNDIYRRRDPRAYYHVLGGLDYVIPDVARPIFLQLADRCVLERRRPVTILDVGCSYGVNAAQVRHGLSVKQLRERYCSPQIEHLSPERLAELDKNYFAGWPVRDEFRFLGLDPSAEAIQYGRRAGLLADGLAIDLETQVLDARSRALIGQTDLIVSTGCVGYVTATTFAKLLRAGNPRPPWIASFVLRMFDFEPIERALADFGMTTEKFPGATFVQRRFRDVEEYERTIAALRERGLDPAGKESEGLLHAELFVSRPTASVSQAPLTQIVSLTSGIARAFGDRHRDHTMSSIELAA